MCACTKIDGIKWNIRWKNCWQWWWKSNCTSYLLGNFCILWTSNQVKIKDSYYWIHHGKNWKEKDEEERKKEGKRNRETEKKWKEYRRQWRNISINRIEKWWLPSRIFIVNFLLWKSILGQSFLHELYVEVMRSQNSFIKSIYERVTLQSTLNEVILYTNR